MVSQQLRLIRAVTAGPGGWVGDGAVWTASSPPVPSQDPLDPEIGNPIMDLGLRRPGGGGASRTRGCKGILRVVGADSTRRFTMRLVVEWLLDGAAPQWNELRDSQTGLILTPRDIGHDEDFTTMDADLGGHRVAFHLIPLLGNLADGTRVEVWATEVD